MSKPLTKTQAWSLKEAKKVVFKTLGDAPADVYLFGSFTHGEIYPSSDMDIAILPRAPLRPGLVSEIAEALEESAVPYRVDVVDLTRADAAFRARVLKEGIRWTV